ncbi:MAG: metal ABC transporter solute-binding protein, Zn/Mn family, partial [Minisyncoccota bacterium]
LIAIEQLDQRFYEGLQGCEKHDIIVSHEAFGYLARRYGFNTISIAGISPDEEPSPRSLAELVNTARAKGVPYVFFETTASPRLSETIAREIGVQTLVLNPLESLTVSEIQSGEDYHSVMEKNLTNLRKALICP